jgi:hypothetical protein
LALSVAAAISRFGFESSAALATVVGVLIEVAGDVAGRANRQRRKTLVRIGTLIFPIPPAALPTAGDQITVPSCAPP